MLKKLYPDYIFPTIQDIDDDFFRKLNIRFLIMDIDNTLVPYTCPEPTKQAHAFLQRLKKANIAGGFVSNNHAARVELFNKTIGLPYICNAKKPFTAGIKKLMKIIEADKMHTALIGDQIFTDIYGGNRAGLTTILVNPIESSETPFFAFKRKYEKMVLKKMEEEKKICLKSTDAQNILQ